MESSEARDHNEIQDVEMDEKDEEKADEPQPTLPKQSIPSIVRTMSQALVKRPTETQLVSP